ncbi:MAG: porin family protein [Spirochaetes bacterium]|nr:porin family protein [Spirochaetota bacterium]
MKSVKIFALAVVGLMIVPATSFAFIDLGAYGGYSLASLESNSMSEDLKGWEYGCFGHLTLGIPMLFSVGFGGFYHVTDATMDYSGKKTDVTRSSYGIDVMGTIELPMLPVNPFVRAGVAINETLEQELLNIAKKEKKFGSYYFAIGAGYSIFPFVRVFAEYVYNFSKQEDDTKLMSNSLHIGAMLSI